MLDTSADVKSSTSWAIMPSPATQVSSSLEEQAKATHARLVVQTCLVLRACPAAAPSVLRALRPSGQRPVGLAKFLVIDATAVNVIWAVDRQLAHQGSRAPASNGRRIDEPVNAGSG